MTASSADGETVTPGEAASRWALSVAVPQLVGTPEVALRHARPDGRAEGVWCGTVWLGRRGKAS